MKAFKNDDRFCGKPQQAPNADFIFIKTMEVLKHACKQTKD